MEILYTSNDLPLLKTEDGEIYTFSQQNVDILIGELSLDIDACNEIKNKIVKKIQDIVNTKQITESSKPEEITQYIINVTSLGEYHIINQIVDHSIKTYKMISTPKPYDTWLWNETLERWVSPVEYPKKRVDSAPDKYMWSDEDVNWIPVETKPHASWSWDYDKEEYVPPVPYPLDAEPGEFVWSEEKVYWVIND
jgi:hypothetical protein